MRGLYSHSREDQKNILRINFPHLSQFISVRIHVFSCIFTRANTGKRFQANCLCIGFVPGVPLSLSFSLRGFPSETGPRRFRRAQFQTPNSVIFSHRAPARELSELLLAYDLFAKANSPSLSQNSPSLPQNSVSAVLSKQYNSTTILPVSHSLLLCAFWALLFQGLFGFGWDRKSLPFEALPCLGRCQRLGL